MPYVTTPGGGGSGDLVAANNLSDLANAATARTNLDVYSKAETVAEFGTLTSTVSDLESSDFTVVSGAATVTAGDLSVTSASEIRFDLSEDFDDIAFEFDYDAASSWIVFAIGTKTVIKQGIELTRTGGGDTTTNIVTPGVSVLSNLGDQTGQAGLIIRRKGFQIYAYNPTDGLVGVAAPSTNDSGYFWLKTNGTCTLNNVRKRTATPLAISFT